MKKSYLTSKDVMEITGVKKAKAYEIIRGLREKSFDGEHVENSKMAEASAKKIKELIKEHPALDSEIGEILVVNCQTPEKNIQA